MSLLDKIVASIGQGFIAYCSYQFRAMVETGWYMNMIYIMHVVLCTHLESCKMTLLGRWFLMSSFKRCQVSELTTSMSTFVSQLVNTLICSIVETKHIMYFSQRLSIGFYCASWAKLLVTMFNICTFELENRGTRNFIFLKKRKFEQCASYANFVNRVMKASSSPPKGGVWRQQQLSGVEKGRRG